MRVVSKRHFRCHSAMMAPATASAAMPATAVTHLAAAGITAPTTAAELLLRSRLRLTLESPALESLALELRTATPTTASIVVLETPLLEIPAPAATAEGLRNNLLILEPAAAKIIAAEVLAALEALIEPLTESLAVVAKAAAIPVVAELPARILATPVPATIPAAAKAAPAAETASSKGMAAIEVAA